MNIPPGEHLPRIIRLPDERLQAVCDACGWETYPNHYRGPIEWERRAHGTVEACERRSGARGRR